MSLFRKKDSALDSTAVGSREVISSILGKEMRVNGELNFKGKARLDGVVEGNIRGEHLVLSESGRICGDLELLSLICHGTVEGNIKAEQVTAHKTASVHGNLIADRLTVEPGARLHGEITSSQQDAFTHGSPLPPETVSEQD